MAFKWLEPCYTDKSQQILGYVHTYNHHFSFQLFIIEILSGDFLHASGSCFDDVKIFNGSIDCKFFMSVYKYIVLIIQGNQFMSQIHTQIWMLS